jgi:hypothetical protein
MKKRKHKKPFDWTRTIVLVTLCCLAAVFGGPELMEYSKHRQLEKEFAYSFCGLRVIEFASEDPAKARYFYQEAKRIESTIRKKSRIYSIQKQMEKAYWNGK